MTDLNKSKEKSRINVGIVAGLACLGLAVLFVIFNHEGSHTDTPEQADGKQSAQAGRRTSGNSNNGLSQEIPTNSPDGIKSPDKASTAKANVTQPSPPNGPTVTKASRHGDTITSSGVRKTVIDPMASWGESPPWPEGPRLYADVETSNKKYVNLRPNQVGLMPRLNVSASETLAITLSLQESEPGSTVFLELTNGGKFPGESAMGKVVKVGPKRTLSFNVVADTARGNCNVSIRQAGQTCTLPLWVGEPQSLANDETVSN